MSEREKCEDDDEGEYLQNVEIFEAMCVTDNKLGAFENIEFERVDGGHDCDDSLFEETIGERVWGLTEMFPDNVRNSSSRFVSSVENIVRKSYESVCYIWWSAFVVGAVLVGPLAYEYERSKINECGQSRRCAKEKEPNVTQ